MESKKGDFVWSNLGSLILIVALLVVLLIGYLLMRDSISNIWSSIRDWLRFGGG